MRKQIIPMIGIWSRGIIGCCYGCAKVTIPMSEYRSSCCKQSLSDIAAMHFRVRRICSKSAASYFKRHSGRGSTSWCGLRCCWSRNDGSCDGLTRSNSVCSRDAHTQDFSSDYVYCVPDPHAWPLPLPLFNREWKIVLTKGPCRICAFLSQYPKSKANDCG
jgi:hypothetical protein